MFITKAIGANIATFIFEIPMRAIPISSGNGDAMMSAPNTGDSHLINPKWKEFKMCFTTEGFKEPVRSEVNLSLIKKNNMRSPHVAPKAPHKATVIGAPVSAICPRATEAGAIEKTDVKNIPATKLAIAVLPNNWMILSIIPV